MKSINLILIFIGSFILFYLLFCLPFAFFTPYMEIVQDEGAFIGYFVFFGWWLPAMPACEYYEANRAYFKKVF